MKVEIDAPLIDLIQARALQQWVNHWAESIPYVRKVYVVVEGSSEYHQRLLKNNASDLHQSILNNFGR